jgi:hypothetical protein
MSVRSLWRGGRRHIPGLKPGFVVAGDAKAEALAYLEATAKANDGNGKGI